jgi:hypothetical protein
MLVSTESKKVLSAFFVDTCSCPYFGLHSNQANVFYILLNYKILKKTKKTGEDMILPGFSFL